MKLSSAVVFAGFGLMLLALPGEAEAANVRLGLGADYQVARRGLLELTLTVDGAVARYVRVGGRFGALATTGGPVFGVPLDLAVRAELASRRVYLEGLVGPWILFDDRILHLHAGIGFGLQSGGLSFGIEVGWLDPSPMVGLRLAFTI